MAEKGLFLQNVIAIIWDFDKTLSPQYMQAPLFREYDIDEQAFWREVQALPGYYARAGIRVQYDTCYLGHLLSYVQAGRMPGLNNAKLRELGKQIELFPGIPDIFERLKRVMEEEPFVEGDLRLEHYVVSTGLAEMIKGSAIARHLSGIWASEFIETPAQPGFDLSSAPLQGAISQIAGFLDNTTKTRAIFEINKGVNKIPGSTVNDMIPEEERRVPMRNMIYVADGPSDIPSFSVIRKHGGLAYAVYEESSEEQFAQVVHLSETSRVDDYGGADYTAGSKTDRWLRLQVKRIAQRIMDDRKSALGRRVSSGPAHITE
ncbi:MAG: haloacid dehalogenase-like hydrolase [Candidatus Hydrogenedentes bacterium]|nr:haloacid dehalogenase-like hydrolase [Candidatus Hydrogenedentota bacterium]